RLVSRSAPLRDGAARGVRPGLRAHDRVRDRAVERARRDSVSEDAGKRALLSNACLLPGDEAEVLVPEVRVEQSDRAPRLGAVADVGVEGVTPIQQVTYRHAVPSVNAHRERRFDAHDVVVAAARGRADVAHEVFARAYVERGAFAEDQA